MQRTVNPLLHRSTLGAALALAAVAGISMPSPAEAEKPVLSAQQSDPVRMGWMQGFPPPADKTIRFTDPDYFSFPKLRWTVCHFRDLMPTADVERGPGAASGLPLALDAGIDAVRFTPLGSGQPITWAEAFDVNYSDGLLVLHHGRIVYERYAGCLDRDTLHGAMSLTKSSQACWARCWWPRARWTNTPWSAR